MGPLRREQIVRATIRCLARDGYAGLTMKRVAAEAAVSQGILHYYFRDKAAMLAAAALRVTADLDRRVAVEARGARLAEGADGARYIERTAPPRIGVDQERQR